MGIHLSAKYVKDTVVKTVLEIQLKEKIPKLKNVIVTESVTCV